MSSPPDRIILNGIQVVALDEAPSYVPSFIPTSLT